MSTDNTPVWDLSELYSGPDDAKVQDDLKEIAHKTESLISLKERLAVRPVDAEAWSMGLEAYERCAWLSSKLADYARLKNDEDVTDQAAATFQQNIVEKISRLEAEISFFPLMVADLDDTEVAKLVGDGRITAFSEFIRQARRLKPHMLPAEQERLLILTLQREREAWARFENQLGPRLPYGEIEMNGEKVKLNPGLITSLLENPDASVRSQVYSKRCGAFEKEQANLAFAYTEQVRNVMTERELRGYEDLWSWVSDKDDLPKNFVPDLLAEAEKRKGIFTKLFSWKAKRLGRDTIPASDLMAPLPDDAEVEIPWDQAKDMTLSSFGRLSDDFGEASAHFFEYPWIHARPDEHKATGAYCMYAPEHPFILLSYRNKLTNATTLAHEVGHGVHALFFKEQKLIQRHPGLILAETASQFGELLFLDELKARNPESYKAALRHFLEHGMNAIYQQCLITRFEEAAFAQAAATGLSAEWMAQKWLSLKNDLAAGAVTYPDEEKWTWARISHIFFHPFYCYTYAASLLLVLALSEKYAQDPKGFAERFKSLLAAGGSVKADVLLRQTMGISLDDGSYLKLGFDKLEKMVDECIS